MQSEGVAPNAVTFACLLKAWDSIGAIDEVREVHSNVKEAGFETNPLVGTTLVGVYAKLGFLSEAREVLNTILPQDVICWNALISGIVEHGADAEALVCFDEMQQKNIPPSAIVFTCISKACGSLGDMEKAIQTHTEVIKYGLEQDSLIGNSLSSMYAKCGALSEAVKVFEKLLFRDVVSWTALIAGYAEHGHGEEGLKCFETMKFEGFFPNAFSFTCALRSCAISKSLDSGQSIHNEIELKGFVDDIHVANALIGMYAKCGSLLDARCVLKQLLNRDIISWNALISGYTEHGLGQEALNCSDEMQADGFDPDEVTLSALLKVCGTLGALDKGREIHSKLSGGVFAADPCVGSSLISMYAKCGSLLEAQEVFYNIPMRDVMVWTSMIQAFGMNHLGRKAVQCFEDMQKHGVQPNGVTLTCLLSACSHESLAVEGHTYFKAMSQKFGIVPTVEHYNCMVDLLGRSGHIFEAEKLCEFMGLSTEGGLSALLTASRTCGEPELGIRCFEQNVQMNPEDAGTYVLLQDIYSSAGRLDDALRIEDLRRHAGALKKPAKALIEVDGEVHEFVVGNNRSMEIKEKLNSLSSSLKAEGNVSHLEVVSKARSDVEKEASLCEHAEKYALAFGLIHMPQGQTLRVTKNLRMCSECHNASKFLSKAEKREIIIRDNCCIHYFKDGICSCADLF